MATRGVKKKIECWFEVVVAICSISICSNLGTKQGGRAAAVLCTLKYSVRSNHNCSGKETQHQQQQHPCCVGTPSRGLTCMTTTTNHRHHDSFTTTHRSSFRSHRAPTVLSPCVGHVSGFSPSFVSSFFFGVFPPPRPPSPVRIFWWML